MTIHKKLKMTISHTIPFYIIGEKCSVCKKPASHGVEEILGACVVKLNNGMEILGHPFTNYVCCKCFRKIMGIAVTCGK